jgi:hypothetical protein
MVLFEPCWVSSRRVGDAGMVSVFSVSRCSLRACATGVVGGALDLAYARNRVEMRTDQYRAGQYHLRPAMDTSMVSRHLKVGLKIQQAAPVYLEILLLIFYY